MERELEDSIECLRQMGVILEKYSSAQDEACYFDQINKVVDHYGRLYAMQDAVKGRVPVKVIEDYLDQGLSPELYTKHRLEKAEELNQVFTIWRASDIPAAGAYICCMLVLPEPTCQGWLWAL